MALVKQQETCKISWQPQVRTFRITSLVSLRSHWPQAWSWPHTSICLCMLLPTKTKVLRLTIINIGHAMNKIFCYFWNTRTYRTALGPCRKQSQNINFFHLTSKLKFQVDKLNMSNFKVSVTRQMMVKSYGDNRKYGWPKFKDVGRTQSL